MKMERKPFEQRFLDLKNEATKWTSAWKDIQSYIAPDCGGFEGSIPNDGKKIDHKIIIDDHATRQLMILASGMTSGLTSPARPWFRLGVADPDLMKFQPVKEWLDDTQLRMFTVFSRSNLYGVFNSMYYELGGFGTAASIILEDFYDVIRLRNFTIGEYYLGFGPDGRLNAFARRFNMTAGQLVTEFGIENVCPAVKAEFETGRVDQWHSVIHLIETNDKRIPWRADFMGMPFRSVYWEDGSPSDTFLRVSGFHKFPVIAPRWKLTTTSDSYGRGPGWFVLGNVKMLQKMQSKSLSALDKLVDPPMQADSSVEHVNILPGGVSRSNLSVPNAGVRPAYQINPDVKSIEYKIEKVQAAISSGLYSDLFLMLAQSNDTQRTAREIIERHEEKLLVLGPVIDKVKTEKLDPTIDRAFDVMLRAGLIAPPPEELQGMDLKVEYISPLAQAQKMVGMAAIEQSLAFAGTLSAVFPEVKDNIKPDETFREYADMAGVPARILRSDEELQKVRQEKADADAKIKAAAAAGAAVQAAKVLSETKIGQGNALEAVLA